MQHLENFEMEQKTIDLTKANKFALFVNIPWLVLFALPYFLIWRDQFSTSFIKNNLPDFGGVWALLIYGLSVPIILIILIVIHELIHGLVFGWYAKGGYKTISFGVLWKYLAPFCHCNEPLLLKHYIIGAIMPGIALGLIPSILALFTGSFALLMIGWFMTLGAVGDLMIIQLLWKEDKTNSYVLDHPSEAGCFIYREIQSI